MIDLLSILLIYGGHLEGKLVFRRAQELIDVVGHGILVEVSLHCFLETKEFSLFVLDFFLYEIQQEGVVTE